MLTTLHFWVCDAGDSMSFRRRNQIGRGDIQMKGGPVKLMNIIMMMMGGF
jgi:hypothetical protein